MSTKSQRLLDRIKPRLESIDFPNNQYVDEIKDKTMIVLHHSAGWDNSRGMFLDWSTSKERVATCVGITDDGTILQGFSSRRWAYHIGVYSSGNKLTEAYRKLLKAGVTYEEKSIGLEICNFGGLKYREGKYYAWPNNFGIDGKGVVIDEKKVIDYGPKEFRGYRFYERYTAAEIESVRDLCLLWGSTYNIPLDYGHGHNIFDISGDALQQKPGVYTHCSFRTDKSDIHPQPEMIEMLKNLKSDLDNA